MKKKIKFFKIKSFTQGFILATFLTSIFIHAGTLLNGIYSFADGETISASEMNHNFNTIRGDVILDAINTSTLNVTFSNISQDWYSSMTQAAVGYIGLTASIGSLLTRTDPSTSITQSATSGGTMDYLPIAQSGLYEVTILADPASYTATINESNEQVTITSYFNLAIFDASDNTKGEIITGGMGPNVDGIDIGSMAVSAYFSSIHYDNDNDGVVDTIQINDQKVALRKTIYLRAGQAVALLYAIRLEDSNTQTSTDGITYNAGTIQLKIKRLLD